MPREAAEISLRALPLLAAGAVFVFTVKFSSKKREVEELQLEQAKKVFAEHCDAMEVLWLFANTKHERTIVCRFAGAGVPRAPSPPPAPLEDGGGAVESAAADADGGGGGGDGGSKPKVVEVEQLGNYFGTMAKLKRMASESCTRPHLDSTHVATPLPPFFLLVLRCLVP
jgi:hypothetical protein